MQEHRSCWGCRAHHLQCGQEGPNCRNCGVRACYYGPKLLIRQERNPVADVTDASDASVSYRTTSSLQRPSLSSAAQSYTTSSPSSRHASASIGKPSNSQSALPQPLSRHDVVRSTTLFVARGKSELEEDEEMLPGARKRKRLAGPDNENSEDSEIHNAPGAMSGLPAPPAAPGCVIMHGLPTPELSAGLAPRSCSTSGSFFPLNSDRGGSDKISVKSLLNGVGGSTPETTPLAGEILTSTYGFDQGRSDLDLPNNNDRDALIIIQTAERTKRHAKSKNLDGPFSQEGYYAQPVLVKIPGSLKPLPSLLQNDMNMLYFHHFINCTAKVLATHDCVNNPFSTVLPQMAVRDNNLLGLMLTYSACHRARLLCHPEPVTRIATWVSNVFPTFRKALAEGRRLTDGTVATAVVLTSLTLSFPNAFDTFLFWDHQLDIARRMIQSRCDAGMLPPFFLRRWFTYLDVFGSLSSTSYDWKFSKKWTIEFLVGDQDPRSNCILGTTQSLALLARAAELVRRSDIECSRTGGASDATMAAAEKLRFELEMAAHNIPYTSCPHLPPSESAVDEMRAINEALRQGGLVYLLRRVFKFSSPSLPVQFHVKQAVAALDRVSEILPDLIFPIFVAGCEAKKPLQREFLQRKLQDIGDAGMAQTEVVLAKLKRCWEADRDWFSQGTEVVFLG